MAELRFENLSKVFPGKYRVAAVQDFSLAVKSGECVALLGPSGAGKSTVLRLIAGLEQPTGGAIFLDNTSLSGVPAGKRKVGVAFQFPALLPQLSVAQNLGLGPKLRGNSDRDAKLVEIAEILGVSQLLARMPETLSGGEQQRIALGRALLAKPRILLLDEPLASLDPLARLELREVIRRVQRKLGLTTIYVTHDQGEAAAVADRIALMREGRLQQFATPQELYLNPANLFVARFFGLDGLNLIQVNIISRENRWFAEAGKLSFALSGPPATSENLLLAFRPSAVRVTKGSGPWSVTEKRNLGWAIVLQLNSGENQIAAHLVADASFKTGDPVEVEIDPSHLLLFGRTMGERVL